MEKSQIGQFRHWIEAFAKKDDVDFDFYGFHQKKTQVLFKKESLKNCSSSEERHFNLRVIKGKKSGASYTKDFSKAGLEACYQQAFNSLNLSDKEEAGSLSEEESYEDFSIFYNSDCKDINIEEKIQKAEELNKACLDFDKKIQAMNSSVFDVDSYHFFGNSRGVEASYNSNDVVAYNQSLAVQDDKRANGFEEGNAKNYKDIKFKRIGERSASKALKKLNYFIPETKRYPVVFQTGQASGHLLKQLVSFLNGKLVFENLSLFKDSLNKKLFSDKVSVYDDPFALWGLRSKPFDGEGFAMEKTPLIDQGVLKNYLTSSFYAKALKAPHTKKALWMDKAKLAISATNLVMREGNSSLEEMLKAFPQVFVIDYLKGFSGFNPVSGNFSIESEGFLWEKGEAKPMCQFTVSGNIREVFSNILKAAQDSEVYYGSVKAPSFLVPDLTIAGK